jgi:hypothetical protein
VLSTASAHRRTNFAWAIEGRVDACLSGHLLAAFRTVAACTHAFPHFTDPLTIRGALLANFGTLATSEFVMFRAEQHEMRGCSTGLSTSRHQREVLGFSVLTTGHQTMPDRGREAHLVTKEAFVDAAFHISVNAMNRLAPFILANFRFLLTERLLQDFRSLTGPRFEKRCSSMPASARLLALVPWISIFFPDHESDERANKKIQHSRVHHRRDGAG